MGRPGDAHVLARVLKPTVVSADVLFEDHRAQLKWEWVAGLGASERRFDEVAVRMSGFRSTNAGFTLVAVPDARKKGFLGKTQIQLKDFQAGGVRVSSLKLEWSDVVYDRADSCEGVVYAALTQVAADLLTSPGRGPAEGEELLRWMEGNEGVWRH